MLEHPVPVLPDVPDVAAPAAPRRRGIGLVLWLGVVSFVIQGAVQATQGILLPNQLAQIDPASKVQNLAIISGVSFAVAIVAQPLVGALSDRTRSRLGRRAPWMLAGAVLAGGAMAAMGWIGSIPALAVAWTLVQLGLNINLSPTAAIVPDRIPVEALGGASALVGFGFMVGAGVGAFAAGALASSLPLAYGVFGGLIVVAVVAFVLANRDRTDGAEVEPFRLGAFLGAFWVSPRKHPDFAWAFLGRFLFVLGYFAVITFTLYLMTDYLHMTLTEATRSAGVLTSTTVLGAVVAIVVGGFLSDRVGRRKPFIYAASIFMAIGMAAPLVLRDFSGLTVLAIFFGIGFGLYQTVDSVLMSMVLPNPTGSAARDLGVLALANSIPQTVAAPLGAALVLVTGGYSGLFVAGIVISIVAGIAIVPIRSVR